MGELDLQERLAMRPTIKECKEFADTIGAAVLLLPDNKCAVMYKNDYGWYQEDTRFVYQDTQTDAWIAIYDVLKEDD